MGSNKATQRFIWTMKFGRDRKHKEYEWFWIFGILTTSVAIAVILLGNVTFGLVIIAGSITFALHINNENETHNYEISIRGIKINDKLYPFKKLESFWFTKNHLDKEILIIKTNDLLFSHIVTTIPQHIKIEELHDLLLDYLPEEEMHEPTLHKIAEIMGF